MIHNFSVDVRYMYFTFVLDFAKCDCIIDRHDSFKLCVENEYILNKHFDVSDNGHRIAHKLLGDKLVELCKNNHWQLYNF